MKNIVHLIIDHPQLSHLGFITGYYGPNWEDLPVVPHKAVAEVSQIGNL